jgi:hypothetical protein
MVRKKNGKNVPACEDVDKNRKMDKKGMHLYEGYLYFCPVNWLLWVCDKR